MIKWRHINTRKYTRTNYNPWKKRHSTQMKSSAYLQSPLILFGYRDTVIRTLYSYWRFTIDTLQLTLVDVSDTNQRQSKTVKSLVGKIMDHKGRLLNLNYGMWMVMNGLSTVPVSRHASVTSVCVTVCVTSSLTEPTSATATPPCSMRSFQTTWNTT